MGQTVVGKICFGITFEEGFEFPWDGYVAGAPDEA